MRTWCSDDGRVTLYCADCLEVLPTLEPVEACITDPPYGLSNHGKRDIVDCLTAWVEGREYAPSKRGFMGKRWDAWVPGPEVWKECFRALKPGAHLLAFAGTRTSDLMSIAIRLAGFEARETACWLYGSGFPKSLDISKAIDKAAGAEREVIGYDASRARPNRKYEGGAIGNIGGTGKASDRTDNGATITTPATEAAKFWDGWGTALKPAHEPAIWARKPLTQVPADGIVLQQAEVFLGGVLCQLLSSASSVDVLSRSSLHEPAGESVSVLLLAAVLHGGQFDEWFEEMATCSSPETVSTCWSIASSWNTILAVLSRHGSRFTTSTATELTTALRILNSWLSKSIPRTIIQAASLPVGKRRSARTAESPLSDESLGSQACHESFAAGLAMLHREYTAAHGAEQNFTEAARAASSVLSDVVQRLTESIPANLRPSHEPIYMAMKPLDGTYAKNALEHGVAGLNIDGCRIPVEGGSPAAARRATARRTGSVPMSVRTLGVETAREANALGRIGRRGSPAVYTTERPSEMSGRWPANVVLDEVAGGLLDEQKGGASRFFYCAKASRSERTCGGLVDNKHPTVKPLSLMRWLVRLVSMPGGSTILDPFMGSGTTGVAALLEGQRFIGIERNEESFNVAVERIQSVGVYPEEFQPEERSTKGGQKKLF